MTEDNSRVDLADRQSPTAQGGAFAAGWRAIVRFLTSARLAISLLIAILACCVIGVTVFRGEEAGALIFSALWFNAMLVLLVLNVAFCFFGRIWGRKLTIVSTGMILFHLSFVAILGGVVYNNLNYFRGLLRLTEGETLPNGDAQSYDYVSEGRFFDYSKLLGETTLIRMHRDYTVDGLNKWAAYEISVGEGSLKKQDVIYITHNLTHRGVTYMPNKEGYSVLVVIHDRSGNELYGAHVPLQSIKQADGSYLYTTGTKDAPGGFPFPHDSSSPLFRLQVVFTPSLLKGEDRKGEVLFLLGPLEQGDEQSTAVKVVEGKAAIGKMFDAGEYFLEAREVRYWVGMNVSYEPGKPIVLTSLWVGLGGMIMTFLGRLWRRKATAAGETGMAGTEGTIATTGMEAEEQQNL